MKKLYIFGIIAGLNSIIYVILVFQNNVPLAHDTFQYLQMQYIYYNEIVQHHSIPIWFPFYNMGGVGNYHLTAQLNILSPIFYLVGLLFKNVNYLYLFYGLIWFEELFFLLGVILLASLYYRDARTIFFVALTLSGTSIWYPQIWWNFHIFYFIPIILYCFHLSLITGHFRYILFFIIFFTLAVFGNFLYCIVFTSFVALIYILLAFLGNFELLGRAKFFFQTNFKLKNIAVLFLLLIICAFSFSYIIYDSQEIEYIRMTRDSSGGNSLNTFLNYGGSIGLGKYKEFLTRYGDSIDINLYAGFLLVPLVGISLAYVRRRIAYSVGGTALIIFLFSIGTIVPYFFYYLYPLGKVFRHIGLTATVCKLFIVFYAGFGFEYFLSRNFKSKIPLLMILFFLVGIACLGPPIINNSYFWVITQNEKMYISIAILSTLFLSILLFGLMYATNIAPKYLIYGLLMLLVIDFFSYKYSLIVTRMPRVGQNVIDLFKPYAYHFPEQRFFDNSMYVNTNQRVASFLSVGPGYGSWYDIIESFLYADTVRSRYRTDFMLKPVYNFLSTTQKFPNKAHDVYRKYVGLQYPKLGVFSNLHVVANESAMGKIFAQKDFTGDMLFTTFGDIQKIRDNIPVQLLQVQGQEVVNHNERLPANIQIKEFSCNTLKLKVTIPGPANKSCLLYYADGYDPHWKAYVNGTITPVIKSNIGFKSIVIPNGESEVTFHFGNSFYTLSMIFTMLLLLTLLCLTIFFYWTELRKREHENCF